MNPDQARKQKLAQALRDNLHRRKAQARAAREAGEPTNPGPTEKK